MQLSPTGIAPWASGLDYNAYPWFFKITGQSSFLLQNNSGTVTYPLEVQNPIAGFGSEAGGTPLYIGQSSRFALHTGGQSAATDVPDEMSIRVYRRSDFAQQGNVVPVQVQALDIPHWKSASATNSAAEWKQFGDNGFQKTFVTTVSGVQVLETTVQLALEAGPDGMFGAGYSAPFIITHRALPGAENYYFSVAAVGNTMVGSNAHWLAVSDPAQAGTSGTFVVGYALNFESAPPWGTTLVKTPHFQGEPAPPTYHGKTAEEIQALTPRFEHQFAAPAGTTYTQLNQAPELQNHTILDRFVSEMGSNPMALVNYVHNEIGLTDALGYNENGDIDEAAVNAGGINRSALATFQEGQGSPDEQCALLVYLLRKAGVHASYVRSSPNAVKMLDQRLSNLLRMRLKGLQTPDGTQPVPQLIGVNYPWVAAYVNVDGVNKWVHLFPWL
ncbi:transglutaminase domain-containing protein, partial [Verrucomicrobium sp. BvORR106]|uniref:transglutaminase domain-containing protein n=1 Tax=Verrucomicrobium sp. BvORR106 TaxID=1403819 RepID=UPI0005713E1A